MRLRGHNVVISVPFRGKTGLERFWEKGYLTRYLVSLYAPVPLERAMNRARVFDGYRLATDDVMLDFRLFWSDLRAYS